MKQILIITGAILFGLSTAYAQQEDNNDSSDKKTVVTKSDTKLKGPNAKNRKVWENKSKKSQGIVSASADDKPMGPTAKNRKPFQSKEDQAYQKVQRDTSRKGLKGPKAKNYRHFWKKKTKPAVEQEKAKPGDVITK